jgi:hypothetical protein
MSYSIELEGLHLPAILESIHRVRVGACSSNGMNIINLEREGGLQPSLDLPLEILTMA